MSDFPKIIVNSDPENVGGALMFVEWDDRNGDFTFQLIGKFDHHAQANEAARALRSALRMAAHYGAAKVRADGPDVDQLFD